MFVTPKVRPESEEHHGMPIIVGSSIISFAVASRKYYISRELLEIVLAIGSKHACRANGRRLICSFPRLKYRERDSRDPSREQRLRSSNKSYVVITHRRRPGMSRSPLDTRP